MLQNQAHHGADNPDRGKLSQLPGMQLIQTITGTSDGERWQEKERTWRKILPIQVFAGILEALYLAHVKSDDKSK